jgi:hypothetical protein
MNQQLVLTACGHSGAALVLQKRIELGLLQAAQFDASVHPLAGVSRASAGCRISFNVC